jgi:hypothetical protein
VENVFLIFGGWGGWGGDRRHVQQPTQAREARGPRRGEGASLFPRLVGGRHHLQPRGSPEPHPQSGPVPTCGRLGHRERLALQGADGRRQHILYAHTLRLLGIGLDQLRPSTTPFHGVAPGKRVQSLGRSTCPSSLARQTISARKPSPLRWSGLGAHITPSLGGRATPSSWRSRTTLTSR